MFNITLTREIDAPTDLVWEVITDFASYGEWNKYIVSCESTLEEGSPMVFRAYLFPYFLTTLNETIYEHVPGRKLRYGLPMPFGAVDGGRCHTISRMDSGKTHYECVYEITGWLSAVVGFVLGRQLERGFALMADCIKERASCLAAQRELSST
jgi:hypothetical protein